MLPQTQDHRLLPPLERLGGELGAQLGQVLAVGQLAEDLGEAAARIDAVVRSPRRTCGPAAAR